MTTAIILNIILATAIFATIVGMLAWAIATQSRDDGRHVVARARGINRQRVPARRPRTAQTEARRTERRQGHGLA